MKRTFGLSSTSAILLIFCMLLTVTAPYPITNAEEYINANQTNEVKETAQYVFSKTPIPSISSIGGEWAVIGIKRSGIAVENSYFDNYLSRAAAKIDSGEGLGRKYTEYSRLAIALCEFDRNPKDFGTSRTNLLDYINDYDSVIIQGINGPIFALEAKKYCGDTDTEIRDKYISYIINMQNSDGSFGLSQGMPDTDITAMAISSLCLYTDINPSIEKIINRAFLFLSSVQQEDGGFYEGLNDTEINCESTAQVIIAMNRFGLKSDDGFFTKNGNTPYDALRKFRCNSGGYKHLLGDSQENPMSTEQALLALTEPNNKNKTLLYDNIWFNSNIKYLEAIK